MWKRAHIYAARDSGQSAGMVKIGHALDAEDRARQLDQGNATGWWTLLGYREGPQHVETEVQVCLGRWMLPGKREHFRPATSVLTFAWLLQADWQEPTVWYHRYAWALDAWESGMLTLARWLTGRETYAEIRGNYERSFERWQALWEDPARADLERRRQQATRDWFLAHGVEDGPLTPWAEVGQLDIDERGSGRWRDHNRLLIF